jgi:hypothetical protein
VVKEGHYGGKRGEGREALRMGKGTWKRKETEGLRVGKGGEGSVESGETGMEGLRMEKRERC